MVRVLTCGSVDDGKSTLIGRLLWDAADLPDDTRATIMASAGADGIPDVSLLLDGLEAERAQGITIDVAWRYFDLASRRYVIIDCPGHEQYTRNMATGASQADIAIMLIDARQGIKLQTRRHAAILELVGIKEVILAINKMDLVDWSEAVYRAIADEFAALSARSGFERAVAIPVASKPGDNIARRSERLRWFNGPTLLDALEATSRSLATATRPFRFPVQRVTRASRDFRGLAGTVASGGVAVGSEIVEVLSGKRALVKRIATFDGDQPTATAGDAVTIVLDRDLDIARGGLLASPSEPATAATDLEVQLVWLADTGPGHSGLLFRTTTDLVPVSEFRVIARMDLQTLQKTAAASCGANDVADARIKLGRGVAVDRFAADHATGHFILVDALTGATVAGGIVADIVQDKEARSGDVFRLTRALLETTVCAD
ncbi:MAG TPA: GTP-binding protein, partial [Hyphomicrobiaceae bacterium]|nr:GTP-binding protein [Hyphomicrobiaceae bacterium]